MSRCGAVILNKHLGPPRQRMSQLLQNVPTSTCFQFGPPCISRGEALLWATHCLLSCAAFSKKIYTKKQPNICRPSRGRGHTGEIQFEDTGEIGDHLICAHHTGPVQVTHKDETDGSISFLDINEQGQQDKDENLQDLDHTDRCLHGQDSVPQLLAVTLWDFSLRVEGSFLPQRLYKLQL